MFYDKFAVSYDKALAPFERRFLSNWRRETLCYLPDNATLLEVGAGTGLNFRFYPNCKHAVAGELSFQMIETAAQKTRAENISLLQADAETLPFPCNSFDAAFATLVFCSLPNPEKAFAELKRVVRPNGRIVLLEHVRPNGVLGYGFDLINLITAPLFKDRFNRRTAKIAKDSGLKILEIKQKALGIVNLIVCEVDK